MTPDSEGDLIGWTNAEFSMLQSIIDLPEPQMRVAKMQPVTTTRPRATEDCILVQPTTDPDSIKPIRAGTKRHLMAVALARGTMLEHLDEFAGWSRSVVSAALFIDLRASGLGIERKAGKLHLILPEDSIGCPFGRRLRRPGIQSPRAKDRMRAGLHCHRCTRRPAL